MQCDVVRCESELCALWLWLWPRSSRAVLLRGKERGRVDVQAERMRGMRSTHRRVMPTLVPTRGVQTGESSAVLLCCAVADAGPAEDDEQRSSDGFRWEILLIRERCEEKDGRERR